MLSLPAESVGPALAARVAAALEAGVITQHNVAIGDHGIYDNICGLETALKPDSWRTRFGLSYHDGYGGRGFAAETASGKQEWRDRAAFVAWLAEQTDASLAAGAGTAASAVTRRRLAALTETALPASPAVVLGQPGGLPAELVPLVESGLDVPVGWALADRAAARLEALVAAGASYGAECGRSWAGVQGAINAGPYWGVWAHDGASHERSVNATVWTAPVRTVGLGYEPATGAWFHAPVLPGYGSGLDLANATRFDSRAAFAAWLAAQELESLGLTRERLERFVGPAPAEPALVERTSAAIERASVAIERNSAATGRVGRKSAWWDLFARCRL